MARGGKLQGVGLGLRRELFPALQRRVPAAIDFFELAPENWLDLGGAAAQVLHGLSERYPIVCHGLSLSLGGPSALDEDLLKRIKKFLRAHHCPLYTEHLSYSGDEGHLYDLLPIPFTEDAVRYVAARVRRAQELLGRRIALENASFYVMAPLAEMTEAEFICAVLEAADCWLQLDVNNVYVNSVNHDYDPYAFLNAMPTERVVYMHVAGHFQETKNLIIDTHGADIIDPVWDLLAHAYTVHGVHPTLLERDFNFPPLPVLVGELKKIAAIQNRQQHGQARRA